MNIHELILDVQGLLGRTMRSAQSSEERELFRAATAALMIAGRCCVALYHRNLNHYSMHLLPVSGPGRLG
jgi:hypothetical protein